MSDGPWSEARAAAYLLRTAADHIEDGTFATDGWCIVDEAQTDAGIDEDTFRSVLRDNLEWDEPTLDEAVATVRGAFKRCGACHGAGELAQPQAVSS